MGRNAGGQKNTRANRAVFADDGISAHDGGPRVDGNVIFDRRMALLASQTLALRQRTRDQAHSLVHLHMIANNGRLPDDRSGAMVHEEVRADLGARVQVHPGADVRPLRHDAGDEGNVLKV